jgi:hypothetical protein
LSCSPRIRTRGAVAAPSDELARAIASGKSLVSGKDFNLIVAFEGGPDRGRAVVESSFHHFADYNWDTRLGAPTFVDDPESSVLAQQPGLLADVKTYVRNVVRWLVADR